MFLAYVMLPLSFILNIIILFPVPQFLKKRIRSLASGSLFGILILSLILFVLYAHAYSASSFDLSEYDLVEHRLEAKSKQWKMERNYHITFANLVGWIVAAGTEKLLTKLDAKLEQKDKKKN